MAEEPDPETEINLEFYREDSQLKLTIEDLIQKTEKLAMHAQNSKDNDPRIHALFIQLKVQRRIQQTQMKNFTDYITEFSGRRPDDHRTSHIFHTGNKRYEKFKERVEEFKKEVNSTKETIDVMMLRLLGLDDYREDEPLVRRYLTPEPMVYEDYIDSNKPLDVRTILEINEGQEVVTGEFEEIECYIDTKKGMGIEGAVRALIEAREALVDKEECGGKKSLLRWIEYFDEGERKELADLIEIRDRVFETGSEFCCMIGVLMFRISEKQNAFEKFLEFKSVLESDSERKSLLVTGKMIESMEIARKEDAARKRLHTRSSFVSGQQKVIVSKEKQKKSVSRQSQTDKSASGESQIYKLLLRFYHEAYRMDFVLSYPGFPAFKEMPSKTLVNRYNEAMQGIVNAVKRLKHIADSIFVFDEASEYKSRQKLVKKNIEDLWKR